MDTDDYRYFRRAALLCCLALVSCAQSEHAKAICTATPTGLQGTRWVEVDPGGSQSPVSLDFAADGRFNGNSGCNLFMGNAEISSTSLRIGSVGSTRMACSGSMEKEYRFLSALAQTRSACQTSSQLDLLGATGNVLWRFKRRE